MVVEVATLCPNPSDLFGPWRLYQSNIDDAATPSGPVFQLRNFDGPACLVVPSAQTWGLGTKGNSIPGATEVELIRSVRTRSPSPSSPGREVGSSPSSPSPPALIPPLRAVSQHPSGSTKKLPLSFSTARSETRVPFRFTPQVSPFRLEDMKRSRPVTDVDGRNTASLSCKKRRLRLQLITSRLSQPFSLPASHILNREALGSGDERFSKLAAQADLVRRSVGHTSLSSVFRRTAVMNRARMHSEEDFRAFTGRNAFSHHGGHPLSVRGLGLVLPVMLQTNKGTAGLRDVSTYHSSGVGKPGHGVPRPTQSGYSITRSNLSLVADARRPRGTPPTSPRLRAVDYRRPPSDRDILEDGDDDGVAFPTSEHESRYEEEDDTEDVYSDFGAIFGVGGDSELDEETDHSYDEYLDELDGISWAVR